MSPPRTESQVVGFRFEPEWWDQLAGRAQRLDVRTHALARLFVIEALAACSQIAELGAVLHERQTKA